MGTQGGVNGMRTCGLCVAQGQARLEWQEEVSAVSLGRGRFPWWESGSRPAVTFQQQLGKPQAESQVREGQGGGSLLSFLRGN